MSSHMRQKASFIVGSLVAVLGLIAACGGSDSQSTQPGTQPKTGGSVGGGSTGKGGQTGNGGALGSGGIASGSGGLTSTGGQVGSGGAVGAGGIASGSGGASGAGGGQSLDGGPACPTSAPSKLCCFVDRHCAAGEGCAGFSCTTEPARAGVCKQLSELATGQCWRDADCSAATGKCVGARICPCGALCLAPDKAGTCAP